MDLFEQYQKSGAHWLDAAHRVATAFGRISAPKEDIELHKERFKVRAGAISQSEYLWGSTFSYYNHKWDTK